MLVTDLKMTLVGGNVVQWLKCIICLNLIPRLQRLFASKRSTEHMTWHKNHVPQDGCVSHPSEAEAWKHFDRLHPSFAAEARNVRLGLCADGFNPYSNEQRNFWFNEFKVSDFSFIKFCYIC